MVKQFPQHHIWKRPFFSFHNQLVVTCTGSGRSPQVGNGNPLQYSYLGNSMVREAWWAIAHGVAKNRTWWSNRVHVPIGYLYSMQNASVCRPFSVATVCLFLCQFHTVVTASAKTLPTPSPGTYWDLVPSCQPFSCSQGFGAPDRLPNTLPSLHFPKGPGVQESQSACGRGSPRPCWSEGTGPHRPEHTRLLQGWGHEEVSHGPWLGRIW